MRKSYDAQFKTRVAPEAIRGARAAARSKRGILLAKPSLDRHDRRAKVIAHTMKDAGLEASQQPPS